MSSLQPIRPRWCGSTVTQLGNLYLHVLPDLRFDEILVLCNNSVRRLDEGESASPPLTHAGTFDG